MTWTKDHTVKFAYPRFGMERPLWLKFRSHCVEGGISVEVAIRKILVRYMKHNNLISKDVPEDLPSVYLSLKKNKRKEQYEKHGV